LFCFDNQLSHAVRMNFRKSDAEAPLSVSEEMVMPFASSLTRLSFDCSSRCHTFPLHLFTNLTELTIDCLCRPSETHNPLAQSLSLLTNLTRLELFIAHVNVKHFPTCTKLEYLLMYDNVENDEMMKHLHPFRNLTSL
jgi:hypothetical protein